MSLCVCEKEEGGEEKHMSSQRKIGYTGIQDLIKGNDAK